MAAIADKILGWAAQITTELALVLDDPEAKHDLAVHIPDSQLLTGHVIGLP